MERVASQTLPLNFFLLRVRRAVRGTQRREKYIFGEEGGEWVVVTVLMICEEDE